MSALVQPAAPTGQHLAKWGIRRSRGEAHQQQRDSRRAVAPSFYRRRVVRGATLWRSAKVVRASGGLRENDNRQACSLTARVTIFLRFFDGASQAESESPSQLQALRVCVCTSSLLLSLPTPFCSVVLNPLTFNCVLIFQPVLRFCFSVGGNSFRRLLSLSLSARNPSTPFSPGLRSPRTGLPPCLRSGASPITTARMWATTTTGLATR